MAESASKAYRSAAFRFAAIVSAIAVGGIVAATAGATHSANLPPNPPAAGVKLAAAQHYVLSHLGVPKFVPEGPAFNIKAVTKPVWLLEAVAKYPPVPQVASGFIAAAKAAGVPYHVCLANGTPEGNALCLQQAAAAHAGSAVIWSVPLKQIAEPLRKARAAGVKVVSGNDALRIGEPAPPAVDAEVSHDYYGAGLEIGAYAVAAKGSTLDGICINVPDFYTGTAVCDGFTKQVHAFCPACKVKTIDVPGATALTQAPAVVNQTVLSDSKMNFIATSYDYLDAVVGAELKTLGKKPGDIMVAGQNGSVAPLQAIRQGGYDVANPGQNPFWWGWSFFDAGARVQVGAIGKHAVVTTPNEFFTKETFHYSGTFSYDNANKIYQLGNGNVYVKAYEKLWKK